VKPRRKLALELVFALAVFVVLLIARTAAAHAIGASQGEYEAEPGGMRARITFARREILALVPALDANGDGHVTALEAEAARPALERSILFRTSVRGRGGEACLGAISDVALTEEDGLVVAGRFSCEAGASRYEVTFGWLDDVAPGHRHVARVVRGGVTMREELFVADGARELQALTLEVAPATSAEPLPNARTDEPTTKRSWSGFLYWGFSHVLTGYDHLLFLVALLLARARPRELLAIVTAFTIAHSLTLALAVLGVIVPSPRLIEPAIGLSIVYVGVENFLMRDARKRWRVAFVFGLLHGFAFAGALRGLHVPDGNLLVALFSFNVGVEAGQLAVMALVLPVILHLRRTSSLFDRRAVPTVSGAVALAGGVVFVARLI
jgi:hydrogenase/urease accessory protein HupE